MLACDPAIDWSTVKTREDLMHFMNRDVTIASVLEKDVLSKHRKALVLIGVAHLYHKRAQPGPKTAVEAYEGTYPGVTLVIADHTGFGNWSPLSKFNDEFESRMASWSIPSLVQDMSGTWLADLLDKTHSSGTVSVMITVGKDGKRVETRTGPGDVTKEFSKMVDAYLYLGPRDLLLNETRPAEVFLNKEYMAEMQRRAGIMGEGPVTDQANPQKVSDRDYGPFLYDQNEFQRMKRTNPQPQH